MTAKTKNAFEVNWRIENVIPWFQMNDSLCCPEFLAETLSNTRWKLRLSRKWQQEERYISLALERDIEDDYPKPIVLNYELTILACDGSPLKSKSFTSKFSPETVGQELKVKGVEILEGKKEAYLPEGVLTVSCKLWIDPYTIKKGGQCSIRSVIGKKRITLESSIDHLSMRKCQTNATVNFILPSSEICFISFDVKLNRLKDPYDYGYTYQLILERKKLVCKCFSFYSCEILSWDAEERYQIIDHTSSTLLSSNEKCAFTSTVFSRDTLQYLRNNDKLNIQIRITCYPGIASEGIEYGDIKDKKMTNGSVVQENVDTFISEKVHSSPLDCLHLPEKEDKTCDIETIESSDEDEHFNLSSKKYLPSTTLKADLTTLYEDRLFCDTKLQTDTETFPAHRNVLSARSPVFKKMFTTDMKEKAGECINIQDISSDTLRRMLQFLYTDYTGDLDVQSAKDLYVAADKYDISSLKQLCTSFMKKNLCPANVCEVLVLADMHQDKNLESAAQEYVLDNDEEVFCSDQWKLFMKNYGSLAAQVMFLKFSKNK